MFVLDRRVALLLTFFIISCSKELPSVNKDFVKKYQKEVEKINEQRVLEKREGQETTFSQPPTEEEVAENLAKKVEYFPYVDINRIGDAPKQVNLPNREIYQQAGSPANSLPPNIFELSYNLALYPPFHKIGAEFDKINVPRSDAFGVTTELSGKSYLLVGNNSLQKSVDSINSQKTETDLEISAMLVQEKKKMQKQDMAKRNFGNQESADSSKKIPEITEEKEVKKDTPIQTNAVVERLSGFVRSVIENKNAPTK